MTTKIDPFRGVVKPETLVPQIKACVAGDRNAVSYLRGSLQVLENKPPNPYIVPLLRKAMETRKC